MTTRTVSLLPFPSDKGLFKLIIILAFLLVVSCSHPPLMNKNLTAASQGTSASAARAQEAEPHFGDTRINDGVEYIYGKNVRYLTTPGEPEYVWVRKDQYFPDASDSPRRRTAMPTKEQNEMAERIARLEKELKTGDAAQPVSLASPDSKAPTSDDAGRKWTSYAEDGNGIGYFYDRDTIARPSKDLVQIWRKREFPSGAGQRQIVSLDEIDCRGARYRSLELSVTDRDGTIRTFAKATPWAKVSTDSAEEYLMTEQCK